jgi:hypothetical protein
MLNVTTKSLITEVINLRISFNILLIFVALIVTQGNESGERKDTS